MSHVKLTAEWGDSGLNYSGLRRVVLEGESVDAVEAARAVLTKSGLGTPRNVDITVHTCSVGPASFSVYALGDVRSRTAGVAVTQEEAQRFGVECLRRLGIQVQTPEPAEAPWPAEALQPPQTTPLQRST